MELGDETGLDVVRSVSAGSSGTGIPAVDSLGGRVIEISGTAGSGKTSIALQAVVHCILPEHLGGCDGTVLFFDSDLRLNASRLVQLLLSQVERKLKELHPGNGQDLDDESLHSLLSLCMQRILILRCTSNLQLLWTLYSFSDQFIREQKVKLIVFDSISSFYWQDLETESLGAGLHVSVPVAIGELVKKHPLTVVAIKPGFFQPRPADPCPEYLSQTWRKLVDTKLFVEPVEETGDFRVHQMKANKVLFQFRITEDGFHIL